ncbi:hypothetical protein CRI94_13085 [Longibacter salinarum]|uniref:Uncharacterized protein n=1 Tax=Longibacter salinarum TaxID=1850348 RepID=A0A2A8CWE8_9BACT|nr:hypothetical protein [Longibacter salinarum]PEN12931.1 hypothetical protein CRI94_13085 [Longibacter salinarum]
MTHASTNPQRLIQTLIEIDAPVVISIYVPLERTWNRNNMFQKELRGLLEQAEIECERFTHASADITPMLEQAAGEITAARAADPDADGIVIILTPSEMIVESLPFTPPLHAAVDTVPDLRYIWPNVYPDRPYYVAALSAGGVGLFRGTRYSIQRVDLGPDAYQTLDEFRQFDQPVRSVRYHTGTPAQGQGGGGRRPAMFFGHEDAGDRAYKNEGILQFLRYIDNQIRKRIDPDVPLRPLLLAGPDRLRGLYRAVNQYPRLHDTEIEGEYTEGTNRAWDTQALHASAWPLIQTDLLREREEAMDRFRGAAERGSTSLSPILSGAVSGRVDTLFISAAAPPVWGNIGEDGVPHLRVDRRRGDGDLLNAALIHTLRTGGVAYAYEDGVPAFAERRQQPRIAARFRY